MRQLHLLYCKFTRGHANITEQLPHANVALALPYFHAVAAFAFLLSSEQYRTAQSGNELQKCRVNVALRARQGKERSRLESRVNARESVKLRKKIINPGRTP